MNKKLCKILRDIDRDFNYDLVELRTKGLKEICIENNVDYYELSEAEKEELWNELLEMAEEIELIRFADDDLHWK